MRKLSAIFILAISSALTCSHASAVTINGLSYKLVSTTGGLCPDGKKKYIYGGKPYCRTYKAAISWSIPSTRVNGTALKLTELKGYQVYWTRSSDTTSGIISVGSASAQTTALEVFKPDQYHFAISAIDTAGLKSPLSGMVSARLGN